MFSNEWFVLCLRRGDVLINSFVYNSAVLGDMRNWRSSERACLHASLPQINWQPTPNQERHSHRSKVLYAFGDAEIRKVEKGLQKQDALPPFLQVGRGTMAKGESNLPLDVRVPNDFSPLWSARAAAELAIRREMSLARTDTPSRQRNAPNRDQLNTNSVKTRTIVAGAPGSGRTACVLGIRSVALPVWMATKTPRLQRITVPTKKNRFHVNDAPHHQTVMPEIFLLYRTFLTLILIAEQARAKAFNTTNERETMANTKSIFEGVKSKFIVTIWIPMILRNMWRCERERKRTTRCFTANARTICQSARMGRAATMNPFTMARRGSIKFAWISTHFRLSTMIINFRIPLDERKSSRQAAIATATQARVHKGTSLWTSRELGSEYGRPTRGRPTAPIPR